MKLRACITLLIKLLALFSVQSLASVNAMQNYQNQAYNILVIHSIEQSKPWSQGSTKAMREILIKQKLPYRIYSEHLSAELFSQKTQHDAFASFLASRYQTTTLDYVVAHGPQAVLFLEQRLTLFKNIPRIYLDTMSPEAFKSSNVVIAKSFGTNYLQSIREVMAISRPEHLYIIGDTSATAGHKKSLQGIEQAITTIKINHPKLTVTWWLDVPSPELYRQVGKLPQKSAIFYLPVVNDRVGNKISAYEFSCRLSQVANAPIYSKWRELLGCGLLGGYMISARDAGKAIVTSIQQAINNNSAQIKEPYGYQRIYDWQQLIRWQIPPESLPAGTQFINQPLLFSGVYKEELTIVAFAIVLICILLLMIVKQNVDYRQQNNKLSYLTENLEKIVNERTQELQKARFRAEKLARLDPLTGINNRRSFFERGHEFFSLAKRYLQTFSVIMVDLDHFKQINDTYGHIVGDEVLKSVANLIDHVFRHADTCARIGGEEFAIIMPYTDIAHATETAQRLNQKISALKVKSKAGFIAVTASMGVSEYREIDNDFLLILERADNALYQAKAEGRNKVVHYASTYSQN